MASCPRHADKTPSLTLYPDGNAYCFSCRHSWFNVGMSGMQFDYTADNTPNTPIPFDRVEKWHKNLLDYDAGMEYFIGRGFEEETIVQEMWGWDEIMHRYVITVWSGAPRKSDVVQVRLRASSKSQSPKYLGLKGHNKAELYNSYTLNGAKKACMFFGELDAQLCTQYGFPSVSMTNGKGTFKVDWVRMFASVETLYIIPDRGEEIDACKIAGYFGGRAQVKTLPFEVNNNEVKDFNEFILHGGTQEQFVKVLYGSEESFGVEPWWAINYKEPYEN